MAHAPLQGATQLLALVLIETVLKHTKAPQFDFVRFLPWMSKLGCSIESRPFNSKPRAA